MKTAEELADSIHHYDGKITRLMVEDLVREVQIDALKAASLECELLAVDKYGARYAYEYLREAAERIRKLIDKK